MHIFVPALLPQAALFQTQPPLWLLSRSQDCDHACVRALYLAMTGSHKLFIGKHSPMLATLGAELVTRLLHGSSVVPTCHLNDLTI